MFKHAGFVVLAAALLTLTAPGVACAEDSLPDDTVLEVLDSVLAEIPYTPTPTVPAPQQVPAPPVG